MKHSVKADWKGMIVMGTIITGDWEGDPAVPNGVHHFDPYVDECEVIAPDGDSIEDDLTERALTKCRDALMEAWNDREGY